MNNNRAHEIIVEILQKSLIGKLDPSSNFSPQFVAEAITERVIFDKSYDETSKDKIVGTLIESVVAYKNEMEEYLKDIVKHTSNEEKIFLGNFVHGKITAYNEVLDILKNIK